jgi:Holliday junction resolvase
MAMTPEGKVKKKVVEALKKHNVYYFFPATGGYGRSGVPDIVCCIKGRFLAIECKANGNNPTALQTREMDKINEAGGMAIVVRDTDYELVDKLLTDIERLLT